MFMRATLGFEQDVMREGLLPRPRCIKDVKTNVENSRQYTFTSRERRIRAPETSLQRFEHVPISHLSSGNRIRYMPGRSSVDECCGRLTKREPY
jgi:hypothetical protein